MKALIQTDISALTILHYITKQCATPDIIIELSVIPKITMEEHSDEIDNDTDNCNIIIREASISTTGSEGRVKTILNDNDFVTREINFDFAVFHDEDYVYNLKHIYTQILDILLEIHYKSLVGKNFIEPYIQL